MRHEKIIKRNNGTQYQIIVDLFIDRINQSVKWIVQAWYREKHKQTWLNVPDTLYDNTIKRMTLKDQEEHRMKNILRFVTPDEILQAKLELWNKIKPV